MTIHGSSNTSINSNSNSSIHGISMVTVHIWNPPSPTAAAAAAAALSSSMWSMDENMVQWQCMRAFSTTKMSSPRDRMMTIMDCFNGHEEEDDVILKEVRENTAQWMIQDVIEDNHPFDQEEGTTTAAAAGTTTDEFQSFIVQLETSSRNNDGVITALCLQQGMRWTTSCPGSRFQMIPDDSKSVTSRNLKKKKKKGKDNKEEKNKKKKEKKGKKRSKTVPPSMEPTEIPSLSPSDIPSEIPSVVATEAPSLIPSSSNAPSISLAPSTTPSSTPTKVPSATPSTNPTSKPSISAAPSTSAAPSRKASTVPTVVPTISDQPSNSPTIYLQVTTIALVLEGLDVRTLDCTIINQLEGTFYGFLNSTLDDGMYLNDVQIMNGDCREGSSNGITSQTGNDPLLIQVSAYVSSSYQSDSTLRALRMAGFLYGAVTAAIASNNSALITQIQNTNPAFLNVLGILQIEPPSTQPSLAPTGTPSTTPTVPPSGTPSATPTYIPSVSMYPTVPLTMVPTVVPSVSMVPSLSNAPTQDVAEWMLEMIGLVNDERAKENAGPLCYNGKLISAAVGHTRDMVDNNFFSHTGSDGSSLGTRVERANYRYWAAGENIAMGQRTVESVVQAWMNSPGHRANILNSQFTHFGTAMINYRWTQVFGTSGVEDCRSYQASNAPSISAVPTATHSSLPSEMPSETPSVVRSMVPSFEPSFQPSVLPSQVPSKAPIVSMNPSNLPSVASSDAPSMFPSEFPSYDPSTAPSDVPTTEPSYVPSTNPSVSHAPSGVPSESPSDRPSTIPSDSPTNVPSESPSTSPSISFEPSMVPSISHMPSISSAPSVLSEVPSDSPTLLPTISDVPSYTPTVSAIPSVSAAPTYVGVSLLERAILEDLMSNIPASDLCNGSGADAASTLEYTASEDGTWYMHSSAKPYERSNFLAEMSYTSSSSHQNWTLKIGQGGNIYSLSNDILGEVLSKQYESGTYFIDDVIQQVCYTLESFQGDYYMYQSGSYQDDATYLTNTSTMWYSPNLAKYCTDDGLECTFLSWSQQAVVPTAYKSAVLNLSRYRNCGDGIIEMSQVLYNTANGTATSYDSSITGNEVLITNDVTDLVYLTAPQMNVRLSTARDVLLHSDVNDVTSTLEIVPNLKDYSYEDGTAYVLDADAGTAGYVVLAHDVSEEPSDVFTMPVDDNTGEVLSITWDGSSNGGDVCVHDEVLSEYYGRYYVSCSMVPSVSNEILSGCTEALGCDLWFQNNNGTTDSFGIHVIGVLYWALSISQIVLFVNEDEYDVTALNAVFQDGTSVSSISYYDTATGSSSATMGAMSHVFGIQDSSSSGMISQVLFGTKGDLFYDAMRYQYMILPTSANYYVSNEEAYGTRQYLLFDSLSELNNDANDASRANSFVNEAYHSSISLLDSSTYRTVSLYLDASRGMVGSTVSNTGNANSMCGGQSTVQEVCTGYTTPRTISGTTTKALYYIYCSDTVTYIGHDLYGLSVYSTDTNTDTVRSYACKGVDDVTARPRWEILGFFEAGACSSVQYDYLYDADMCSEYTNIPSEVPSVYPSLSEAPSETPTSSDVPSQIPSRIPSEVPTSSDVPSQIPSQIPSEVPTSSDVPSQIPSGVPSDVLL